MRNLLQLALLIPFTVALPFEDELIPEFVEQSIKETHSEILFDIPVDALEVVFGRFGKPMRCDHKLVYQGFLANDGYVQLQGGYTNDEDSTFDARIRCRHTSEGASSCMISGEIEFGKESELQLPFVITVAKTGVNTNGHDKIEGHVVWLNLKE